MAATNKVKTSARGARAERVKEHRDSYPEGEQLNEQSQPWRQPLRPVSAQSPKDSGFVLEDEVIIPTVELLLQSFCISAPHQDGNPLSFVSPGFEVLTGYTADEMAGKNCRLLQGNKPDAATTSLLRAALDERRFVSVELANARKDGRPFQNFLCIVPVLDTSNNLLNFFGVQCDLDERRKREAVDDAFLAKWQEQVKHYVQAFALVDISSPSTPICAITPGLADLTGYASADVLGWSLLCLCGPDSSEREMRKLVSSQRAASPCAVKLLAYKRDGTPFWAYVFSCPLAPGQSAAYAQGAAAGPAGGGKRAPAAPRHALCLVLDITATRLKRVGKYVLGKVIGTGAFGLVRIGRNHQTDEVVAVKSVDGSRFRNIQEIEQIQEEMSVLASLKHPNIIRLYDVHFQNNVFYLVMEFASGGSLVKYIHAASDKHCLPEDDASRVFSQMVSALDYCHRRRVCHRDLKPENILLDEHKNLKIADFGLAAVAAPFSGGLTLQCGTPEFTAPEITTGREYDGPGVDIWSMGVILYEALTGGLPFKGANQQALFKAIQRGVYDPLPTHLTMECKDLVRRMLTVDPSQRISMDEIVRHPWFRAAATPNSPSMSQLDLPGSQSPSGQQQASSSRPASAAWGSDGVAARASMGGSILSRGGDLSGASSRPTSLSGAPPESIHDSVRLVIPTMADRDDPILSAIVRGQQASFEHSPARGLGSEDDELVVQTSSQSFSPVSGTPHGGAGSRRDTTPSASTLHHRGGAGGPRSGGAKQRGALLPTLGSSGASPAAPSLLERRAGMEPSSRFKSPAKASRSSPIAGGRSQQAADSNGRALPPITQQQVRGSPSGKKPSFYS